MSTPAAYPACYPRAPKPCKSVAVQFFTCLNENSAKQSPSDTEAANRGLKACMEQMKAYEQCMDTLEKKNPPKRFRVRDTKRHSFPNLVQVQDEYRMTASS